jgi:toxin ParE1/3/4
MAFLGMERTRAYYQDIISTFELLAASPKLARERMEFSPPVRVHPHASHSIIYRIEENTVFITRILRGNMDIDS